VWLQLVMFCKNNPNIKDDKLGNPMKNMNMIFGAPEFVPACFFWFEHRGDPLMNESF
jgi:hypothetical protein